MSVDDVSDVSARSVNAVFLPPSADRAQCPQLATGTVLLSTDGSEGLIE